MVGGLSHLPTCRSLASGRWAVLPPYSRHASPSWAWWSPLLRYRLGPKAVRHKTIYNLPPSDIIRRVICHVILPAWPPATVLPSHPATSLPCPATSSDLSYCHVISVHDDVTLLMSSAYVIIHTRSHMLTSSAIFGVKSEIATLEPRNQFPRQFLMRIAG